jgi:CubicO group peptidase (beta-lactamase class C family)
MSIHSAVRRNALLTVALVAFMAPPRAIAQQLPPLAGVWGGVLDLPPAVAGRIELRESRGHWEMTIVAPATAPIAGVVQGDTIRFTLPGQPASLRVELARSPRGLEPRLAFWVQPPGMGPAYATPVPLERIAASRWRGEVRPLVERFTLFLALRAWRGDTSWGRFYNPEGNFGGGRAFRVVREPTRLLLFDSLSGRQRFAQAWDAEARTIGFEFGEPLVLREVLPTTSRGLAPRLPGEPPSYRPPRLRSDGWPVRPIAAGTPARRALDRLVGEWSALPLDRVGRPRLHAVLVARRGALQVEEYFRGVTAETLHDLRSASKSFTAVAFGALLQQEHERGRGVRSTVHDTVWRAAPNAAITVAQLLTHSSGLACDDNDQDSPGNEDRMQSQQEQPDWYAYAKALPITHAPGTHYAYCSAGINLVGGWIAERSGQWLPAFFARRLAEPLGIGRYAWNLMPTGAGYAGGGLHLRARDFLKFGQLWQGGGTWRGRRLVPADWVRASVARQQPDPAGADDGYAWHRHTIRIGGRVVESYEASGNGGQFLLVVPSLDLVVVVLAEHYGEGARWLRLRDEVIVPVVEAVTAGG